MKGQYVVAAAMLMSMQWWLDRHLYVLSCRVVQEENLAGDVLPLIPRPEDLVEIARRASHL